MTVDRTPENREAVLRLLREEFRGDAEVDCYSRPEKRLVPDTTFRIMVPGQRPLLLRIEMKVMEDMEPDVLMRRLREGRVVERLRDGESLVMTTAGIEPLDPRG